MRTTLVGCGFLGGLFIEEIVKRGFALEEKLDLTLVDPQQVEMRNVANQAFGPADVGSFKALALLERIKSYPSVESATPQVHKLEESTIGILDKADLIVCAVDNIPARILCWQEALRRQIPLLSLGISQGGTGSVDWSDWSRGVDTSTLNPIQLARLSQEQVVEMGKVKKLPPCELTAFRALGVNVALAAMKSFWIARGFDPELHVLSEVVGAGVLTTWDASSTGHTLRERLT